MKRFISILLAAAVSAGGAAAACAKEDEKTLKLTIGSPTMTVDGAEEAIDAEGTAPVIINDRTLVPIRAIIEAMGGTVAWDGGTQTVTLDMDGSKVTLTIDSTAAYLNGEEHTLDTAPQIINDRTMLPIRFIAESFGFNVAWDGDDQTITIASDAAKKETPVVAEVGDIKITVGDVMSFLYNEIGSDDYIEENFDQLKNEYAQSVYDITRYGVCARAMGYGISDEELKEVIAAIPDQDKNELAVYGINAEFVASVYYYSAAINELIENELYDKVQQAVAEKLPSDDEMKKELVSTHYRAKHILVGTDGADGKTDEELAKDILEQAKSGADFETLIVKYNTDPGMSSNPNGYVFEDGDMVKEFEEGVKSLKPGEFGICKSVYGWHVIERLPLTENDDDISSWLELYKEKKQEELMEAESRRMLDELCEKNGITSTIYQETLDAFTLEDYKAIYD